MTPKRLAKLSKVIAHRQNNITVILEDVHDAHNIAATMRSCDSIGINELYIIFTDAVRYCKIGKNNPMATILDDVSKKISGHAKKWLNIHYFESTEACFRAVRKKYQHIYTTHLSADAKSLYDLKLTQSVALVFGNESSGVSAAALKLSDGNFIIPQVGMTQSLNISVACAVSLYEAYRQRKVAGLYDTPSFNANEQQLLLHDWSQR